MLPDQPELGGYRGLDRVAEVLTYQPALRRTFVAVVLPQADHVVEQRLRLIRLLRQPELAAPLRSLLLIPAFTLLCSLPSLPSASFASLYSTLSPSTVLLDS